MALFQPSTKAVSAVCQEIADSVGASGDTEMTTRAGRSLFAALQHFNNKANWDFLRAEAPPVTVYAPFQVTGVSASGGQASAACPAGHGLQPDDMILGSGFGAGTRVSATAASGFGIYGTITFTTSGVSAVTVTSQRDMYALPSDWKAPYGARLLGSNTDLRYIGRRYYDRSSLPPESDTSTPYFYDLFLVGGRGKIRLLQPPPTAEILQLRYYRRMTIATATGDSTAIDIVQDYEPYLIAWSKWHFLMDKGQGHERQAQTWFALGEEGIKTMLRDQTRIPDEAPMFLPGHYPYRSWSDRSTSMIPWDFA